jgi:hypothetical protein
LDEAEQDAERQLRAERENLAEAQQKLDESLSRLDRLRRQRRSLVTRGSELTRRGLASLDEMEAEDEATVATQAAAFDAQSLGAVGVIDWDAILVDPVGLDGVGGLDFAGGSVEAPVGNPASAP